MNLFEAMKVFVKVTETGSLSGAARSLNLSNPSVTRHIADLEQYLGARLLNRSTRRLSLTDTGSAYLERCQQLLADLEQATLAAGMHAANPSGVLRINAPVSFSVNHLGLLLPLYAQRYPNVELDVTLSDRIVDLVEEGFDLAIRIGRLQNSSLVMRKLAPAHVLTCAAPAYLAQHGIPQHPADLARHTCLTYAYTLPDNEWRLQRGGKIHTVRISGGLHCNNGDLLLAAAVAGMGVIRQPTFIIGDAIRDGRLVPILTDYHGDALAIHAVYPSRQHLSAKVRTFVDFLVQQFGEVPAWDRALPI
ncbi:DNA-binding transcriptional regulator, LysR family [Collimonas sp. OK242]|jgi:DNA-binding transcriptional LysR family regulator|uniref:LysR family transcriptional regulator n=1 Tax=Collimonas sp. OK242 TaxID=1798195 RepID=UPI000895F691|nr:LysR family transcriptional regulator [Collimonas sp. OK242]SDY36368.1 DNA-binding transcriptional regulator, LysR family [Collimonas sp. OK242]